MENKVHPFELLGKSFIKIPRRVLEAVVNIQDAEHNKMKVYAALLLRSYFISGSVKSGGQRIACNRGEYIGNYSELEGMCFLSKTSLCNHIKQLQQEGLVKSGRVKNSLRVVVNNYDDICGISAPEKKEDAKKRADAQKKKTGNAPASYSPPVCYGSNTRPVVYDENGQMITDGDEARRIAAERRKKENYN